MIKIVLAIDPGKKKCGIAVVDNKLHFIEGAIVENKELIHKIGMYLEKHSIRHIVVGSGTNSREIKKRINNKVSGINIIEIPEKDSTIEARKRYFDYHPPAGFLKLFPKTFLIPPRPYDDFAALIIAERFFKNYNQQDISNNRGLL
jgi:RNase H-fold protein (predicted Holliday junction resolvase)